jgi:hypothetical protein
MVTIFQQDLVIKMEPADSESDSEIQISSIFRDKSNPVGLSDDVRIVKEVRSVAVQFGENEGGSHFWVGRGGGGAVMSR